MTWGQLSLALSRKVQSKPIDELASALNLAYSSILRERRWQGLLQARTLVTAAPYTTGTIDLTQASTSVTGTGTAFSSSMVGRWLQVAGSNELYSVASVESGTALTLDRVFAETTAAAAGFSIWQDTYTLDDEIREVLSVEFPGLLQPVEGTSQDGLRRFCPLPSTLGAPRLWAPYHDEPDAFDGVQIRRITLAPAPDGVYGLRVNCIMAARGFDGSNTEESPLAWVDDGALYGAALQILTDGQLGANLAGAGLARMKVEDSRLTGPQRFAMASRFTAHRARRWMR